MKKILIASLVAAVGGTASADFAEAFPHLDTRSSGPAFAITAANDAATGSFEVNWDQGEWNGSTWSYTIDEAMDIDGIGTVNSATVVIASGQRGAGQTVSLNFNVAAGVSNTVFGFNSALAPAVLQNASGRASAAVTLTDTNGDGATLSPDGSSIYTASYNGAPGTVFDNLMAANLVVGAWATDTASDDSPNGGGFSAIGVPLTDISSEWNFAVSAFDVASGTSVFTVIPTPGSLALLGMAGFIARRRR